jgi:hypothetical protein
MSASVVLPDVGVGTIEQLAGSGQAVLLEREPYFPANGSVSVLGLTPTGETDLPDDGVDVIDCGRAMGAVGEKRRKWDAS